MIISKKTSAAPSASFESAILRDDEIRHVFDQVEGVITACGEHSQTDAVDGAADSQLAGETYGVRVGSDVVDEFVFRLDTGGLDAGAHRFSADMSGSAAVAGSAVGPAASRGAGGDASGSTSGTCAYSTPQWVKFRHMPSSV